MATDQVAQEAAAPPRPERDAMPVHGIDHVEFYVGNAAQAAHFFTTAYGFTETAYSGLETGRRDRRSHVVEQGRIRLVLTGTLRGSDEIADHHARHGDGVHKIALSVPDAAHAYEHAVAHGARGVHEPHWTEDDHGRVGLSSVATYGDTLHLFVQRDGYEGAFLPGYEARGRAPSDPDEMLLMAIDHIVGNVEDGQMQEWVAYYERVFGIDRDDPFRRQGHQHRVLGPDVQGRARTAAGGSSSRSTSRPEGKRRSQIEEYLDFYNGAGVQHIALATRGHRRLRRRAPRTTG